MRTRLQRTIGLGLVALTLAASAQAQGKGHGKDKGQGKHGDRVEVGDRVETADPRHGGTGVIRDGRGRDDREARDDRDDRDGRYGRYGRDGGNRAGRVPPGLAKKPGQMPPGQYKKRYGTDQGASVLSEIMRQRGYTVTRIVPAGYNQNVYYRRSTGGERLAIVSPGTNRLSFQNVPAALLQQVLARLY
ncbi:hypothetical protein BH11GEM1_BH11GEM1_36200 [soil metagenome]